MMTGIAPALTAVVLGVMSAAAQPPPNLGIELAENGHCAEATPLLKRGLAKVTDKELRKTIGVHLTRCAMTLNSVDEAIATMRLLTHEFPGDPEVLYLATHVYSDISIRASQELMFKSPTSPQVHELNAEALETQGKWDEAASEYQQVLKQDPNLPGIHFKLGRLYLSRPKTPTTMGDARREFEEELKINPRNAGAEYVLGEIARQAEQWPEAIAHFTQASKLDSRFVEAYLGLGRSLLATDKNAEAIPPLEKAVKLQPDNPETHFHLATAYRRAGRKADADREILAQKQAADKARQARDDLNKALTGAQVERPPR